VVSCPSPRAVAHQSIRIQNQNSCTPLVASTIRTHRAQLARAKPAASRVPSSRGRPAAHCSSRRRVVPGSKGSQRQGVLLLCFAQGAVVGRSGSAIARAVGARWGRVYVGAVDLLVYRRRVLPIHIRRHPRWPRRKSQRESRAALGRRLAGRWLGRGGGGGCLATAASSEESKGEQGGAREEASGPLARKGRRWWLSSHRVAAWEGAPAPTAGFTVPLHRPDAAAGEGKRKSGGGRRVR
jgi:hypothetical protein